MNCNSRDLKEVLLKKFIIPEIEQCGHLKGKTILACSISRLFIIRYCVVAELEQQFLASLAIYFTGVGVTSFAMVFSGYLTVAPGDKSVVVIEGDVELGNPVARCLEIKWQGRRRERVKNLFEIEQTQELGCPNLIQLNLLKPSNQDSFWDARHFLQQCKQNKLKFVLEGIA